MNKKKLILTLAFLALVLGLNSSATYAGDGAHGTESEKLYLKVVLSDPFKAKKYYEAIKNLKELLKDDTFKEDMVTYLQQIPITEMHDPDSQTVFSTMKQMALTYEEKQGLNPLQVPYDFSRTENPRATAALAKEVLATTYNVQDVPCIDSQHVPREATTESHPRSATCVYPKGLALIYVMTSVQRIYPDSERAFLFGALSHELARKYDLDDDNGLVFPMAKETNWQNLVYDQTCYTHKPFCQSRNIINQDPEIQPLSWAPYLGEHFVDVSIAMPKPGKKEYFAWKECMKDNFILQNTQGTSGYTSQMIIPLVDKTNGTFFLRVDLDRDVEIHKSKSGRLDSLSLRVANRRNLSMENLAGKKFTFFADSPRRASVVSCATYVLDFKSQGIVLGEATHKGWSDPGSQRWLDTQPGFPMQIESQYGDFGDFARRDAITQLSLIVRQ